MGEREAFVEDFEHLLAFHRDGTLEFYMTPEYYRDILRFCEEHSDYVFKRVGVDIMTPAWIDGDVERQRAEMHKFMLAVYPAYLGACKDDPELIKWNYTIKISGKNSRLPSSGDPMSRFLQATQYSAVAFGFKLYGPQGLPYVPYLLSCCTILRTIAYIDDNDVICACMMYQLPLATPLVTMKNIEEHFGLRVVHMMVQCIDYERSGRNFDFLKSLTPEVRLIAMARMYHSTAMLREFPNSEDPRVIQKDMEYFRSFLDSVKGTNTPLEEAFERLLAGFFVIRGESYPCLVQQRK